MFLALALMAAHAADHGEAPITSADPAADINDLYAWVEGGSLYAIVTFDPFLGPGVGYDADVLYTFHIDTDADNIADLAIDARFGQNAALAWGLQVVGLSGAGTPVVGPVETVTSVGANSIYAGATDDPFFFDLTGFGDTLATGSLMFDSTRDGFAGLNVHSIAIQTTAPAGPFQIWATSSRIVAL